MGKKDPPQLHQRSGVAMRRSTVINALLCLLGIGGLISCSLLGYGIGLHSQSPLLSDDAPFQQLLGRDNRHVRASRSQLFEAAAMRQGERLQQHRQQHSDELKWETIPDGWEDYTFADIRNHFNCDEHAYDQNKPLPSLAEWTFLRKQMKLLVDPRLNLEDPVPPTQGYSLGNTGAPPPYYAQRSERKGRGLFASRDIKKGELVQDGPHSFIVFPDALSFRRLVFALPRKSACDITEWAWHQELTPGGRLTIVVDTNTAALMNSSPEPNIAPKTDTDTKLYAVRDIRKGEEIYYDYNIYETDWSKVGLD
ncbi:hypothetical protein ACHAXH_009022 [Discostella pseudostelligera]